MDDEALFVSSSGQQETFECAFVWRGIPASVQLPVPPCRFGWTEAAKALLLRMRRNAKETGRSEGNELPYSDLRGSLQARVPGLVLLDSRILPFEDNSPLFAASGTPLDTKAAANRAVSVWCQLTLRPWSDKLGIDCGDVDALEARAQRRELFEDSVALRPPLEGQVPDALRADFHDYADTMLAIATPVLEGAELFPGLGPVHRVVDREFGNAISFETWPSALSGGEDLFSMVAELSVETRPSSRLPFLVVRAAKRIWCREFPAPGQLFGRRRISTRVLLREPGVRAINLSVSLDKGIPSTRVDSLLYQAARETGESFTGELIELVKNRGRMPDFFVGVPFRYGYRPTPRIEAGVTLQDQLDLLQAVKERISPLGFANSRLRVLEAPTERPKEFHQQATLYNLITHHFGRIPSDDELPQRVQELFGSTESKPRGRPRPIKTVDLAPILQTNQERLDKAFGQGTKVDLVFVCRRETEERIFTSVVALLFGDRVNVVRYALPEGVHGTKKSLDGDARLTRLQRAAARKEAWLGFATQLQREHPNSPVIVQAAREYDGLEEDSVNKNVGRNTLATVAGCSVQYLLPHGEGKAAEYMHRVQAALYDLLYAHTGLGPVPASLVSSTFAAIKRPRTIVGISIVSQAASRTGRVEGGALAVAMKVDVASGRVSGRIGWIRDHRFDTGKFQALSRTLVDVASAGLTSLGKKHQDRRKNFLSFVRDVVDEISGHDPNALVMLESTTSRSLWSWLSDENICSDIYLEDQAARPPASWKGLRFVRVRERSAGRLGVEKHRNWIPVTRQGEQRHAAVATEIYATAIERLAESLPEGNARARHYLCAHGFGIRNRGARGQSTYRNKPGFNKVGAKTPKGTTFGNRVLSRPGSNPPWDQPSRLPTTLEITVLPSQLGDDEDAIATLVACLRIGYSHTADGTFLPSPLSFKSKIDDYMDRYGTGREVDDQEAVAEDEESDPSEDVEAIEIRDTGVVGYGEIRRWYEGSADDRENAMPEFDDTEFSDDDVVPGTTHASNGTPALEKQSDDVPLESTELAVPNASNGSTVMVTPPTTPPLLDVVQAYPPQETTATDTLLATLRSPCAPLPSFVTEAFLASAMHVVNSDARRMYEDREWIRTVTGFPWPEERPGTEEFPRLYLDALRYPAFSIVIQHQFFPADHGRGLPKKQILFKNEDFMKRLRKERAFPKGDNNLSVIRALNSADNGGDKEALFAEMLGLPGQGAWHTKCAMASAGIDRLEKRGGEWGELGRYLRAVVGPFFPLGDGQTIGQVMEEVVIPEAMRLAEEATSQKTIVYVPDDVIDEQRVDVGDKTITNENSLAELDKSWLFHCECIETLARGASSAGPIVGDVSEIGRSLSILLELKDRASRLVPAKTPTIELRVSIRRLATRAADALSSLIGDPLTAPLILEKLASLPGECATPQMDSANALLREAEAFIAEADAIGGEIDRIEAELPIKQARQQTAPLFETRERALRQGLERAEGALEVVFAASPPLAAAPQPIDDNPATIDPDAPDVPTPAVTDTSPEIVEDVQDLPIAEEPLEEAPRIQPITVQKPKADEAPDPLREAVTARLNHLFRLGEFGLAFHLREAAATAMPQLDELYSATELRLASAAGHAIGLSGEEMQLLSELRSEALNIAEALSRRTDDRSVARLSLLIASAIRAALFRPDDTSAFYLVEKTAVLPPFDHYRKLASVADENRKLGFPLTPANLMAAEAQSRENTFVMDAVTAIKETISGLKASRFRLHLGERVRVVLTQQQGLLGRLSSQLSDSALESAREAAELLHGRDKIRSFVTTIVGQIDAGQEIDVLARLRIFAVLSRVGQQCSDLIQAIEGLNTLRKSSGRMDTVKRLRDMALIGIENVLDHSQSLQSDTLTAAVARHIETLMRSMQEVLKGKPSPDKEGAPLAVGLHTPLLWLPKMTWTGGWTPSPYMPELILHEALSVPVPLIGDDAVSSIETAFEARRSESAFVPAHMLLNIAHWYGVDADRTEPLRAKLDADKEAKINQVKMRLREAERNIDRMRRMAVGSLDQSARLKETLSSINPAHLPVELSPTFLPETLEGDRIEDFNSAFARIRDVETEAQREFSKATGEYSAQIHELDEKGELDPQTGSELRNLLERREFTTLADWLNMLKRGIRKPLLPSGPLNHRLVKFKSLLPQLSTVDVLQIARAIDGGNAFGPLDFRHLEQDQRPQAAAIARSFPALKRAIKSSAASQIKDAVVGIVSQLLYEVGRCEEDQVLTRIRQQVYVFDAGVSMPPTNSNSLLLPEFGSLTQGSWRICVVTSTISQQALVDLGDGAGSRGVLVLYLGVLNADRRHQLRLDLIKLKRAILVVDEALVAFALADHDDRRQAILDIAQGYSSADPYKDHGRSAVPPEMFKGRTWERSAIIDQFGSYVVFGGRRLGKTALLQQIHANPPAHAVFAYVDLDMVTDASVAFEMMSRRIVIFKSQVSTGEEFASTIISWLEEDDRRRLLLLLDEADNFVRQEAETGFRCIRSLLQLIADSKNRFKFVLAGLHNVSRIVRAENSPLVHISNNPLQIGPLLNKDVDDAELLVRGPFAAMGLEFDKREDVWRILSFTNYYPVLIQVFCQELLRLIRDQVQQTGRVPLIIDTALIEHAVSSSEVKKKLFETFQKTIINIEGRYELLTDILAARELVDRASGMTAEGMSAAEVAERAMEYWPAAFPRGSDPTTIEYLLEEMEGFGIARRTLSGNFALRSRSLLELMAFGEAELTKKLDSYRTAKAPPKAFDPKNFRRVLGKPLPAVQSHGHISPLTDGQEADLLAPFAPAGDATGGSNGVPRSTGLGVVFGTECAGIHFVEAALMDASRTKSKLVDVDQRTYDSKSEMLEDAKRPPKSGRPRVIVISPKTQWRPDWVVEAERVGRVRKGDVRLVFVGEPKHASDWSRDLTVLKRVLPQIKIVKLRPLTRSYLGARLESVQLAGEFVDRILLATGGWSETVGPLLTQIADKPGEAASLVQAAAQALPGTPDLFAKLGIPSDLIGFFRELAAYAKESTITFTDFQYLCTADNRKISPRSIGIYSDLLGIMSFPPDPSGVQGTRKVDLNPLVHESLLRPE